MPNKILICTDLDRTLIPNGHAPESPQARSRFRELVRQDSVYLAYVSGRHKQLVLDAIQEYELPLPDFAITDVGSNIYQVQDNQWTIWQHWQDEIAPDWHNYSGEEMAAWLNDLTRLRLQEPEKQNRFKLSYYAPADIDKDRLLRVISKRLRDKGIKANLIWSIDETTETGLLDILPVSANKLHAIHFLIEEKGFARENTLFSGDSGNDLEVLCSDIPSVLVNNATEEIKNLATQQAQQSDFAEHLYLATGNFMGMNGNYAAGILEGLLHYHPELRVLVDKS